MTPRPIAEGCHGDGTRDVALSLNGNCFRRSHTGATVPTFRRAYGQFQSCSVERGSADGLAGCFDGGSRSKSGQFRRWREHSAETGRVLSSRHASAGMQIGLAPSQMLDQVIPSGRTGHGHFSATNGMPADAQRRTSRGSDDQPRNAT